MVFTLYGDYLLQRRDAVWAGSLVTMLGQLGMKPMAVRTTLSRMTAKGWLSVERRGARSYYGLTARGRKLLESGRERIYHPPRQHAWDGSWHLISYSIPESRRHLRDSLRVKLAWLGCGAVGNGLWMSPHDVRRDVMEIAAELKISRHVEIFRAHHESGSSMRALIARGWDLDALQVRYVAFVKRWRPQAEHCSACRGLSSPSARLACQAPADCFVRRFTLVHEYRSFPMHDPYLPAALLPDGWAGDEAVAIFERFHRVLTVPAERYVREVCDAGEEGAHVSAKELLLAV
jgi:phenylacetic acid degradation operon negative regulatory protein